MADELSTNENESPKVMLKWILGVAIVAMVILVLVIIFQSIPSSAIPGESSSSNSADQTILTELSATLSPVGTGVTSQTVTVRNTTWIGCDGINDLINITIPESKATVSLWYQNATTTWTNIIQSEGNTYIDDVLNNGWTFIPYYINGDNLQFCKTDSTTFVNVSIDEIRMYEVALNSSQRTTVFEDGR